jgi:cell division control protein 6
MNNADMLNNIFEKFVSEVRIFKDRMVLRHDYIPDRLPHREEQVQLLGEIMAPMLKGERGSNLFIYGKTGTGKTAVVKYVLGLLEIKAKEFNVPVKVCYVNCRLAGSEYRVFAGLSQNIGLQIPFTGLSSGEVFDRFRLALENARTNLAIVLDEIDELVKAKGDDVLYELTRINESLHYSKASFIGISNDLRLKEFLDPRAFSSLSEEELVFRPYDASELRNILCERAYLAFWKGALSDAALGLCSALAAAEHGDARRALDLLRVSGEVAERKNANVIGEEHVREAERRIEHNRVFDALKNLTLHSKLVTLGIYHLNKASGQKAITGEIYDVYGELCGQLGVTPLTQRRVGTLVNELDSMGLLNAKVVSMGRYGRTKKIRLDIARTVLKDVFADDGRLGPLFDYRPKCLSKRLDD